VPNVDVSRPAVLSRFFDFWMLGGASIFLLIVMWIALPYKESNQLVQQKFMMLAPLFAILGAVCNHPHFLISYKFGYSRGYKFVLQYWFSLVAVPILLLLMFAMAFKSFDSEIVQSDFVDFLNQIFMTVGVQLRFGINNNWGQEIMAYSIFLMYLTVGWHYSKQVYGCMMVYNHYDNYDLGKLQKLTFKYSLLFLAFYQFIYATSLNVNPDGYKDPRFSGVMMTNISVPSIWISISQIICYILFFLNIGIFIYQYIKYKKIVSPVMFVIWLAIYSWWVQVGQLPEYYYMAVPFFHSLQYLPFAFKMETKEVKSNKHQAFKFSKIILLWVFMGLLFFEVIPTYLDQVTNTSINQTTWFFITAFAVFINVHHFFIDSVVWRFNQKEVKAGILR
jgi:hypothetical protein